MANGDGAPGRRDARGASGGADCYAALDLGTNNCRLLIARPAASGFRVVEAFSRIVRLGEGLSRTGRLQDEAMDRALAALRICSDRLARRPVVRMRAVATQACRAAENGPDFIRRVREETGLELSIIGPEEEARLSVAGCVNLLDPAGEAALVVDVGGGSTELSWLRLRPGRGAVDFEVVAWMSAPLGVVTLAERHPEPDPPTHGWYEAMVADVETALDAVGARADGLRASFEGGRAHMVGTSGAITSLAGLHLNLARYERARVDGLWMSRGECEAAAQRLMDLGPVGRAREPCIGADRADLVL
ncbi:MAG TPA: Ppx/GppA phosphatase family protein, partial [Caulobacteraceae bacterium]